MLASMSATEKAACADGARSTKQTSARAQSSPVGSGPHSKQRRFAPRSSTSSVTDVLSAAYTRALSAERRGRRARGGDLVEARDGREVRRGALDVDLVEEVVGRRDDGRDARDRARRHARLELDAGVAAGQCVGDELDDEERLGDPEEERVERRAARGPPGLERLHAARGQRGRVRVEVVRVEADAVVHERRVPVARALATTKGGARERRGARAPRSRRGPRRTWPRGLRCRARRSSATPRRRRGGSRSPRPGSGARRRRRAGTRSWRPRSRMSPRTPCSTCPRRARRPRRAWSRSRRRGSRRTRSRARRGPAAAAARGRARRSRARRSRPRPSPASPRGPAP